MATEVPNGTNSANGANGAKSFEPYFDIPKECKAGVVVDEGPNFRVEVQMVPVPEIGSQDSVFFQRAVLTFLIRSR